MEVVLNWSRPFGLASRDQRAMFAPPARSGVYLWTVANEAEPRVSYVGEASNLADRFYEHVFWTLGGAYCLYGDDHLMDGQRPEPVYRPSMNALLVQFLDEEGGYRELARRNLGTYRFWWATLEAERVTREAVESALIATARDNGEPLQNERVSRGPHSSPRLRIQSIFPEGCRIGSVDRVIEYGQLDPGA